MKRGEIWSAAARVEYAGKPRPVIVLQSDAFDATDSITICPVTSDPTPAHLLRVDLAPDDANRLRFESHAMIDKVTTIPREKLGRRIGVVSNSDMERIAEGVLVFLSLVESPQ